MLPIVIRNNKKVFFFTKSKIKFDILHTIGHNYHEAKGNRSILHLTHLPMSKLTAFQESVLTHIQYWEEKDDFECAFHGIPRGACTDDMETIVVSNTEKREDIDGNMVQFIALLNMGAIKQETIRIAGVLEFPVFRVSPDFISKK